MELVDLGNGYSMVNEFMNTKNGFAHKSTLFLHNNEINKHRSNYLNRTWERYTYQSCMLGCVRDLIEKKQNEFIKMCKEHYNIKRLTKEKREQALKIVEELTQVKELREILKKIENKDIEYRE